MTWETYERDLDRQIETLHERVKSGAYRALPSRRSYIPKEDGSKRPLAVAALEDKNRSESRGGCANPTFSTRPLNDDFSAR
jgi:hypothetical protein